MVPEIWSEKEIFVILGHFVALSEKSKFSKNEKKKTLEIIIILHLCTTNDNHMMYGS